MRPGATEGLSQMQPEAMKVFHTRRHERRQARNIVAQAVHESRLAGMRDKAWVSEYQNNTTLP